MQEKAIVQVNHLLSVWTNTLITEAPLQRASSKSVRSITAHRRNPNNISNILNFFPSKYFLKLQTQSFLQSSIFTFRSQYWNK